MSDSAPPSDQQAHGASGGALDALGALGREPFVALTTYRRTGEAVATPVWAAPDPDVAGRLWVTTPSGSGKVKRLAHTPRVSLVACDRRGRTTPGALAVAAVATVLDDDASRDRVHGALLAKHGAAVRVVDALFVTARLRARVLRRPAPRRVCLRLDPPA